MHKIISIFILNVIINNNLTVQKLTIMSLNIFSGNDIFKCQKELDLIAQLTQKGAYHEEFF